MSMKFKQLISVFLLIFAITTPALASEDVTGKVYPLTEGQQHEAQEVLYTIAWIDNYRPNTVVVYTYDDYGYPLTRNYLDPYHYLELYNAYNVGYFNVVVTNLNDRILYNGRVFHGETLELYK